MAIREYNSKQQMLFLEISLDALPEDHLCFTVDDIVERLDFSSLPDRRETPGCPAYDFRLLTKVLFLGYAEGIFSSRNPSHFNLLPQL